MKIPSNKIKDVIRFFREELTDLYDSNEVEIFIRYCFEEFCGINAVSLKFSEEKTISESELLKFNFAIKDLKAYRPIQYILSTADFYGLKFKVNEHVLIPRPETEEIVHLIINDYKHHSSPFTILDIGTGSGCIPIGLKKNLPEAEITGVDISEEALMIAKENSVNNNAEVRFIREDILAPSEKLSGQKFDIIVSNPPYIKASEKSAMEENVLNFEPHIALFVADDDALLFYKKIADFALKNLNQNGRIYFEINSALGVEAKQLIESKGFKNVELIKDISNNNRILRGTL